MIQVCRQRPAWMCAWNSTLVAAITAAFLTASVDARAQASDGVQTPAAQTPAAQTPAAQTPAAQSAPSDAKPPSTEQAPASDLLTKPIAEVAEPRHDFGRVWLNDQLKHSFKIRNAGEVPLKIIRVRPACGCTVAGAYPHELGPGESGELPFQLNTKRLKGKFTKSVTVTTNDPKAAQIQLILSGEVQHPVDVSPQIVQFGRVKADSVITNKVTLTNNTGERLEVTLDSKEQVKWLTTKIEETVPGKQFDVSVSAHPPYDTGINRVSLALHTNLAQQSEINLTCIATLPNRIELRPNKIQLSGRVTRSSQRKVLLTNNDDKPIHIVSAESTDERLTVETTEIEAGRRYQFSVNIPATYALPKTDAAIVIKTDDEKDAEVRIPVVGRQTPRPPRSEPPIKQLVGKTLPEQRTTTFDGNEITVGGNQDKVQLVMFYASWCGFCRKALPKIEDLHEKYKDNPNVEVLAINLDDRAGRRARTESETIEHYKEMKLKLPMVLDSEKEIGKPYMVGSFPTMFLLGKSGEIEDVQVGAAAGFDTKFGDEIEMLLAGKSRADFKGASASRRGVRPAMLKPVTVRSAAATGDEQDTAADAVDDADHDQDRDDAAADGVDSPE